MEYGLCYIPTYDASRDGTYADWYDGMLGEVKAAERLGFTGAWFAEHKVPDRTQFSRADRQRRADQIRKHRGTDQPGWEERPQVAQPITHRAVVRAGKDDSERERAEQ